MDKKRLLELAGVPLVEDNTPTEKQIADLITDWVLDGFVDHYFDLRRAGHLQDAPGPRGLEDYTRLTLDMTPNWLDALMDRVLDDVRSGIESRLPQKIRHARREAVAQKRQRGE